MTILTPEVRAILKRMDADDAMEAAARAGWNAALEVAAKEIEVREGSYLANVILALKEQK